MKWKLGILICMALWGFSVALLAEAKQAKLGPASAQVDPPEIHFFTFGDWGTGDENQRLVAQALARHCRVARCDFGLLLGDNFYPRGVKSVTDPKWKNYFETVYRALNLPFYVALGNHDHKGNAQAQIDYTGQQKRWTMPAHQFKISFPQDSPNPLLEIFVIDSKNFNAPDGQQLKVDLENSKARWKILAMHDPLYSNAKHGDSRSLKKALIPIICHQVDLVLSGHDHLFSHLKDPDDTCRFQQIVVGTGGKGLFKSKADSRVRFAKSAFGFAYLVVKPTGITLRFHEADGSTPYSFSYPEKKKE